MHESEIWCSYPTVSDARSRRVVYSVVSVTETPPGEIKFPALINAKATQIEKD